MSSELYDQIHTLLDNKKAGVLTTWNQILAGLLQAKVAHTRVVRVSELVVHPLNRKGLGVNAYNVHSTLDKVRTMGADKKKLKQAAAFEMSSDAGKRDEQLAFMQRLIDGAGGMLAPLSGDERLMTVAASHFSQACRAVKAGCRTPEPNLKDAAGNLNEIHVCGSDAELTKLINVGWNFVIIPEFVESLFPMLPDVAQSALNAEHTAFSMASELQVMAGMHQIMQKGGTEDDAIAAAKTAIPPCNDYIHILADFVSKYTDGDSGRIISYLDAFGKDFGSNKKIGEVFFTAVVQAQFPTNTTTFPLVRSALVATNLVSPKGKISNGIAELLRKSDVAKLTSKKELVNVIATENLLREVWAVLEEVRKDGKLIETMCNVLFGKISARTMLFILGKQKDGHEYSQTGAIYETFTQIKEVFLQELQHASNGGVTAPTTEPANSPADKPSASERPVDLASASDPKFIALQAGWKPNTLFVKRDGDEVYELQELTNFGAHFKEQVIGPFEADEMDVKFDDLGKIFRLFRGKLQEKLAHDAGQYRIDRSEHYQREIERSKVFLAFCKAAMSHAAAETERLQFYINPAEVRVKVERIAKGALQLLPATELQKISAVEGPSSLKVKSGSHVFYVNGPPQAKSHQAHVSKQAVFSAFWWVKVTDDQFEANLKKTKISVDDIVVPMYENTKVLKEFDELVVFIPGGQPPAKKSKSIA